jgi:hypothetical protein
MRLKGPWSAAQVATFLDRVAIALGQIGSAKLIIARSCKRQSGILGVGLLVCQVIAYSTFTFYPPPLAIFEDSRNGTRGIPAAVAVPR